MDDSGWREIMYGCERWLAVQRPRTAAEILHAAADALPVDGRPDAYGEGAIVEEIEARVAQLLTCEAAVVMPTGTMAQQIALRIHAEQRGLRTVAFHPTCHLELHERGGYAQLHGLAAELVGQPDQLISLSDLEQVHVGLAALLLELPQREIGGRLPEWDDLVAQTDWARERAIALHLDGARLWEAAPYYGRAPGEVAALFDTIYVSLYKGLGGFAGCLLAGSSQTIAQARVWRRRHGGTLYGLFPLVASALDGLQRRVERMGEFLGHARALADALRDLPGIDVVPDPPQTALLHLHLHGDCERIWERMLEIAGDRRVWLGHRPAPTVVAGVCRLELHLGEAALEIGAVEAAELFAAAVER
jgi:threonine aldolase